MSQSYANHRRFDPAYHYVAFVLLLACISYAVAHIIHHRPGSWGELLLILLVGIVLVKERTYALRVQDRVIRLEETLRMRAILPPELAARIGDLKPSQFVGLRFAADAELAARMAEALKEGLSGEDIKKRIQSWRADDFRV